MAICTKRRNFASNKGLLMNSKMNKKLLFACVLLSLTACSKSTDLTNEGNGGKSDESYPNTFEVSVDPGHTWEMSTQNSLTIKSLPADFDTKVFMVLDANPFSTESATILAYEEGNFSNIKYEAPSYATKLYAACVNGDKMRVRSFDVKTGEVDFAASVVANARAKTSRRAAAQLTFQKTFNANHFADQGWDDEFAMLPEPVETESFTDFSEYHSMFKGFLPEGNNNNRKLEGYDDIWKCYTITVSKEDGEVSFVPVHKESTVNQCIGYYYVLPGQDLNIKTCKKYVFPSISKIDDSKDVCTQKVYRLKYFDEQGNESYQFPKGTRIGFFAHVLQSAISSTECLDWYAEGAQNLALSNYIAEKGKTGPLDGYKEFTHVVMFERNNQILVGMEDWIKDFDYNDINIMLRGDIEQLPASDAVVPTHTHIYSYAFEDTQSGDYDLNDVVLQVKRVWGGPNQEVKLVALGAMDRIKAYYKNEQGETIPLFGGKELHEAVGVPQSSFVNTQTLNVEDSKLPKQTIHFNYSTFLYSKADFYIVNETKGQEVHVPSALGLKGQNPNGVCIPFAWQWPLERVRIFTAYPMFKGFAENMEVNTDWYTQPVSGEVFE